MIWMHGEKIYLCLENKPTKSEQKWKSATRRKKRGGACVKEKKYSRHKNKNPEGRGMKEMENIKKREKICSSSPVSSLRATNTSIIPDT